MNWIIEHWDPIARSLIVMIIAAPIARVVIPDLIAMARNEPWWN